MRRVVELAGCWARDADLGPPRRLVAPRRAIWVRGGPVHPLGGGWRIEGRTTEVEAGEAGCVDYEIVVDDRYGTRAASVTSRTGQRRRSVLLRADGEGSWQVYGEPAPALAGRLDVDLEVSTFTNALPVHPLGLGVGKQAEAPAA